VTKRLPRRDVKRRLTLQETMALRGYLDEGALERVFGSLDQAQALYEAHEEEIDGHIRAGHRSAAWWAFRSGAPAELRRRFPQQSEGSAVSEEEAEWPFDRSFAEEYDLHRRQVVWLQEHGHLAEWERREVVAQARWNLDPPNPMSGPGPAQQKVARQLLADLGEDIA
jgi:hypothetical protein